MIALILMLFLQGETDDLRIVLAQAKVESSYRLTDWHEHKSKPGVFFCGPWQTVAYSRRECRRMTSSYEYAYKARKREWALWMSAAKGDVRRALGGYGCGYFGMKHPHKCGVKEGKSYPTRVLEAAREIENLLQFSETRFELTREVEMYLGKKIGISYTEPVESL